MARRIALVAVAIALFGGVVSAQTQVVSEAPLNYDTFMQMDVPSRLASFDRLSPEDRADLIHEQIDRWVDANRDHLTADQLALAAEWLGFVVADNYRLPRSEQITARLRDIEARSTVLFSQQQILEATSIRGAHIPRKVR